MRLELGRIDHQLVGIAALRCEASEDLVEHTQLAPADDPKGGEANRL